MRRRLDIVVVERGLAETRARAQSIIIGSGVRVSGEVIRKAAALVDEDADISLVSEPMPFVSRGGLKLRHALDIFEVRTEGIVALDVGASTGGFTQVLLAAGAARVYALDVGYGQLAWKLRNDDRVVVMERTNIRYVEKLPEQIHLGVIDVSFISLVLVLPVIWRLLLPEGTVIALIKPQFETGARLLRKGVVKDPDVQISAVRRILEFAMKTGWHPKGVTRSPIRGTKGNVEFLAMLSRSAQGTERTIDSLVASIA
jgi:23S rRNA (cytidine1920-2'-O)/16S rRNA (cytidine1409-2'-O)-methyltransferase